MLRMFAIILMTALLISTSSVRAGAAGDPTPSAASEGTSAAGDVVTCFRREARRLSKGPDPAADVVRAARLICSDRVAAYTKTLEAADRQRNGGQYVARDILANSEMTKFVENMATEVAFADVIEMRAGFPPIPLEGAAAVPLPAPSGGVTTLRTRPE